MESKHNRYYLVYYVRSIDIHHLGHANEQNSPSLGQYTFKYNMTPPQATVHGGSSSCYIS
jgi:hypothetical protein